LSTVHSQPPSGVAVGALFRFVSRYKGLMAALVLLGVLLGYGWSSRQPVRYEGVVRFFVEAGSDQSDVDKVVRRQAEVLISPVILDRTVALTGDRLTRKELEKRLTVEPDRAANVITVRALDSTPQRAANLANTVVRAYRMVVAEQITAAAREQIKAIKRRQLVLDSQIATLRRQLQAQPDNQVLVATIDAKNQELRRLAAQVEAANGSATQAARRLETLRDNATVRRDPAQPKPLQSAVIGGLLGLLVSAVLVWWRTRRHGPPPRSSAPELPSPA
jgi:capsular polysaccharide biosynthesis protein